MLKEMVDIYIKHLVHIDCRKQKNFNFFQLMNKLENNNDLIDNEKYYYSLIINLLKVFLEQNKNNCKSDIEEKISYKFMLERARFIRKNVKELLKNPQKISELKINDFYFFYFLNDYPDNGIRMYSRLAKNLFINYTYNNLKRYDLLSNNYYTISDNYSIIRHKEIFKLIPVSKINERDRFSHNNLLEKAIKNKNIRFAKYILKNSDVDINSYFYKKGKAGGSFVFSHCFYYLIESNLSDKEKYKFCKKLIRKGLKLNKIPFFLDYVEVPSILCVKNKISRKFLSYLLVNNLSVHNVDSFGNNVLHFFNDDYIDLIDQVIVMGAEPDLINKSGYSPLYCASEGKNKLKLFDYLLAKKCDPYIVNKFTGKNLIEFILDKEDNDRIKILKDHNLL